MGRARARPPSGGLATGRSADCPSAGDARSGASGATPQAARQPRHGNSRRDAPQAKGTPAARGGSQQQPSAARGAPVAARTATPGAGQTTACGAGPGVVPPGTLPGVVPPSPLPAGGGAGTPAEGALAAGAAVSSWRSVAAGAAPMP